MQKLQLSHTVRKICNATSDEHIVDRFWWFNIVDTGTGGNINWFSIHLRADVLALVYPCSSGPYHCG
jgi:hypothetical protein